MARNIPKSASARGNLAIRMMQSQRELGRRFDDCFECGDGSAVVQHITRRAAAEPDVERAVRRHGCDTWLDPVRYGHLWTAEPHPFANR